MPLPLRCAFLLDLISIWLDACFPGLQTLWPFSLDPFKRVALLLLAAAILIEVGLIVQRFRDQSDTKTSGGSDDVE